MKYHIIQAMLYNHNYSDFESEKQRFIKTVTELGKAFTFYATEEGAQELNSEITCFTN